MQDLEHIREGKCDATMKGSCSYAILCIWTNFVCSQSYWFLDTQTHALTFSLLFNGKIEFIDIFFNRLYQTRHYLEFYCEWKGLVCFWQPFTGGNVLVWFCLLLGLLFFLPWTRSILHQRLQVLLILSRWISYEVWHWMKMESMGSFVLHCVNFEVDTVATSAESDLKLVYHCS